MSWLKQIAFRLRVLFRRGKLDADMAEEMRLHLEVRTQRNMEAGLSPEEARHAAMRNFGGVEQIKELAREQRSWAWLEELICDLRYAFRQLAKSPGFTAVAVLTLGLGIGACTSIFSVVNSVLFRPLAYPDSDGLVVINEIKLPQFPEFSVAPGNYFDWREQSTSFENLAATSSESYTLTGMGEAAHVVGEWVTANYFATLRIRPALGRDFSDEEAAAKAKVVLLSHGCWLRRFGGRPGVVNETVRLNDQVFAIVGVLPENFDRGGRNEIFTLVAYTQDNQDHESHYIRVIGRLKQGISLEQARMEMNVIASRLASRFPATNQGWGVKLTPMLEWTIRDARPMLHALLGAVGFMLLIACVNVANLLLARATARAREISVRSALGASRGRIIRQLLSESVLLAVLSGALGTLLAQGGMSALITFASDHLPRAREIGLDGRALGFTCALTIATGIGFGLVPAFQASRVNLNETLKDGGRGGSEGDRRQRARGLLVIAEVAIALVLLVGAGLLIRSFTRLQNVNPGFQPRDAWAVRLVLPRKNVRTDLQRSAFVAQVTNQLATLRGVQSVGATHALPFSGSDYQLYFNLGGRPAGSSQDAQSTLYYAVTPDYFKAMGIPLRRGRFFTERDTADAPRVAIINETMAKKMFPGEDPIGRRIGLSLFSPAIHREIVGIVGDVKNNHLAEGAQVQTYEPFAQQPFASVAIVVRTSGRVPDLPAAIRGAIYSIDKDQPIASLRPLTELLGTSIARQRFAMLLVAVFSGVALLLAAIGIYGVMAYSVTQRTGEIGIRMALGARRIDVLRLVLSQGGRLVAAGLACGVVGALLLTRFIASLLFDVSAQDPLIFATIAVLLAAVAAIACLVPAWRAANVNPTIALRAG